MRARARPAAVVLALTLVLSGCSSDSDPRFALDDLDDGVCTAAGEPLLELERTQRGFAAQELDAQTAAADYDQLQEQLLAARDDAEPEVSAELRELVTTIGFFRVGVAARTTNEEQTAQLRASLDRVLTACGVPLDEG